jgi:hypothetical protein
MTKHREIFSAMTDQQRKNIVRKCKKQQGWYDGIGSQDELIQKECIARGYTIHHFYNCEGKTLEKLLS